jgi:hypothetical protein
VMVDLRLAREFVAHGYENTAVEFLHDLSQRWPKGEKRLPGWLRNVRRWRGHQGGGRRT